MKAHFLSISFVLAVAILTSSVSVYALPFNDDMVDNQMRAGSIMRPKAEGSVAVGSLAGHVAKRDDALVLTNPMAGDKVSTTSGERLFSANCYACHGDISEKAWQPGPVGKKINAIVAGKPPDLASDYYKTQADGVFYAAMHFGFGLMSNVGWKLSPAEHWDIINYIRKVQASK